MAAGRAAAGTLAVAALWAGAAMADPPALSLPLDCTPGQDCFVQNYVDRDPGPGAVDFLCGPLTYDGHKGTDIRLASRAAMLAGVTARAAAPGRVVAVRDGMADGDYLAGRAAAIEGRECGNGAVIDHGDGWVTQYCHMKRGSLLVKPGQRVARGAPIGQVGLSGKTEFPHLHIAVRKDGAIVDPFDPDGGRCGTPAERTLWADALPYVPGGLLSVGAGGAVPDYEAVRTGTAEPAERVTLSADAPALVGWGFAFGVRKGDRMVFSIDGPQGAVFRHEAVLDKDQAQAYRAAGRRAPAGGWPPGAYRVSVELLRGGESLGRKEITVEVVAGQP